MNSALETGLTEIKFVFTLAYNASGTKFLIDLNQNSTTQKNGEAWDRGRKSKRVIKTLVTNSAVKEHTGLLSYKPNSIF